MYIEKRLIVPLSLILLVVGLVSLLAVVGMTFWLGNRTNEHFDGVIRSRDVRAAAVEIRSAVQSAEASQRGLLLTGNQIYLSPYDAAKATANRQLDNLRRNLDGDPQFQAVLQRLTAIIAEKFAEMDKTIELKNDRKDDEAFAIFNTNRGKALMDEVNLFVSGIVRAMDNRLTSGVVQQRANAANLRFRVHCRLIVDRACRRRRGSDTSAIHERIGRGSRRGLCTERIAGRSSQTTNGRSRESK